MTADHHPDHDRPHHPDRVCLRREPLFPKSSLNPRPNASKGKNKTKNKNRLRPAVKAAHEHPLSESTSTDDSNNTRSRSNGSIVSHDDDDEDDDDDHDHDDSEDEDDFRAARRERSLCVEVLDRLGGPPSLSPSSSSFPFPSPSAPHPPPRRRPPTRTTRPHSTRALRSSLFPHHHHHHSHSHSASARRRSEIHVSSPSSLASLGSLASLTAVPLRKAGVFEFPCDRATAFARTCDAVVRHFDGVFVASPPPLFAAYGERELDKENIVLTGTDRANTDLHFSTTTTTTTSTTTKSTVSMSSYAAPLAMRAKIRVKDSAFLPYRNSLTVTVTAECPADSPFTHSPQPHTPDVRSSTTDHRQHQQEQQGRQHKTRTTTTTTAPFSRVSIRPTFKDSLRIAPEVFDDFCTAVFDRLVQIRQVIRPYYP